MTKQEIEDLRNVFSHKSMYGKLLMTSDVMLNDKDVFGDEENHTLEFDIWDGFAYCYDYEGKEYCMTYPKLGLINLSPDMSNAIREHLNLEEKQKIEVVHVLMTYNKLECANHMVKAI